MKGKMLCTTKKKNKKVISYMYREKVKIKTAVTRYKDLGKEKKVMPVTINQQPRWMTQILTNNPRWLYFFTQTS